MANVQTSFRAGARFVAATAWCRPGTPAAVTRQLKKAIRDTILAVESTIKVEMRRKKHGRKYYYEGRVHIASAPGEAPAIRGGNLFKAVRPIFTNNGMSGRIEPRVPGLPDLASWLENGTTRMDPRPFLNPAYRKHRAAFVKRVKAIVASMGET